MKSNIQKLADAVFEHSGIERENLLDVNRSGADGGFSGFIYYNDTDEFYNANEGLIYELLNEYADDHGFKNVEALISTFKRSDILSSPKGRRQLISWFALEEVARAVEDHTCYYEHEK